ncbi:YihY/virulence factor BrkB family protein [Myxacorys almedinensis]|uniref:YihY family inner membrane protein n=1 Tax=Myxacorys almedinensis A TaxID=2690445 RepID=A0A8J7YZF5_9CYAN|nr:YihY/virulence factor BrkB family protein [Myxacorys almedinensis]NDJ17369.1 YihY family inner membrane protein [Myxacorys almedinensis A]
MTIFRKGWRLLKATIEEWQVNDASLLASSLAYVTVFSLAPLMVIVVMVVGAIFGESTAQEQIVAQLAEFMGEEGAQLMATAIENMRAEAEGGPIQLVISLGFLIFGASGVFSQIQHALDRIWEVKPIPERQWLHFLRKRLLSFAMILAVAFLLLVSFVGTTALAAIVEYLNELAPGLGYVWHLLRWILTFTVTTVIFAMMYTILPDAEIEWRNTVIGAVITTILFLLGQALFGLFLNQTDFGSAYGVAGSFIIVITWIYYAAQVLFIGATFTKVFAQQRGVPIVPSDYAVPISHEERHSRSARQKRQKSPPLRLRHPRR